MQRAVGDNQRVLHRGMDKVQEQGALLPGNEKNFGNREKKCNGIGEIFSFETFLLRKKTRCPPLVTHRHTDSIKEI